MNNRRFRQHLSTAKQFYRCILNQKQWSNATREGGREGGGYVIYGAAALPLLLSLWPCINGNPAKTSPLSAAQNDRSRAHNHRVPVFKLFWMGSLYATLTRLPPRKKHVTVATMRLHMPSSRARGHGCHY